MQKLALATALFVSMPLVALGAPDVPETPRLEDQKTTVHPRAKRSRHPREHRAVTQSQTRIFRLYAPIREFLLNTHRRPLVEAMTRKLSSEIEQGAPEGELTSILLAFKQAAQTVRPSTSSVDLPIDPVEAEKLEKNLVEAITEYVSETPSPAPFEKMVAYTGYLKGRKEGSKAFVPVEGPESSHQKKTLQEIETEYRNAIISVFNDLSQLGFVGETTAQKLGAVEARFEKVLDQYIGQAEAQELENVTTYDRIGAFSPISRAENLSPWSKTAHILLSGLYSGSFILGASEVIRANNAYPMTTAFLALTGVFAIRAAMKYKENLASDTKQKRHETARDKGERLKNQLIKQIKSSFPAVKAAQYLEVREWIPTVSRTTLESIRCEADLHSS